MKRLFFLLLLLLACKNQSTEPPAYQRPEIVFDRFMSYPDILTSYQYDPRTFRIWNVRTESMPWINQGRQPVRVDDYRVIVILEYDQVSGDLLQAHMGEGSISTSERNGIHSATVAPGQQVVFVGLYRDTLQLRPDRDYYYTNVWFSQKNNLIFIFPEEQQKFSSLNDVLQR